MLFGKRVSRSRTWRATVTPLASIIGSGFLVLAPILGRHFGAAAVLVMLGLCLISYALGGAIRANILAIDAAPESPPAFARRIEAAASWSLAFAYVISVTYYLNLFGAFAVSLTPFDSTTNGRIIATAMLVFLAVLGRTRGFINFASRAFAVYYGLQCALAAPTSYRSGSRARAIGFGLLAVTMVLVGVFGAPAE